MSKTNLHANRPLSPHLQIYKPIPTMVMSIVHRITGSALYVGTLLVAWWLIAAATNEEYFNFVNAIYGSWIGRLVLLGYTWALIHHMIGGHTPSDLGYRPWPRKRHDHEDGLGFAHSFRRIDDPRSGSPHSQ